MHPVRRRHEGFFSSLSQVEKRLASEEEKPQPQPLSSSSPIPSLPSASPLFLSDNPIHQPTANTAASSGMPLEFLSNSPATQIQQQQQHADQSDPRDDDDNIDTLISLLGLSFPTCERDTSSASCNCSSGSSGFFRRVVGVKGPRCGKEMERLDAWIDALYSITPNNREPARLAHLLLGKAVALADGSNSGGGIGDVGFPATVEDFLEHDPPVSVPQRVDFLHDLDKENN